MEGASWAHGSAEDQPESGPEGVVSVEEVRLPQGSGLSREVPAQPE